MFFSSLIIQEGTPIYEQIEDYIQQAMANGVMVKGSKLPSTREVSKVLGISRNTVLTAYENLESKGLIYSIKGKGSFIKESYQVREKQKVVLNWLNKVNDYGNSCIDMDIIKSEPGYEKGMISFKSIAPEGTLFDVEEFKRAFLEVIALEGEKILNYGYARGYNKFISFIKEYMLEKGVSLAGKEILITNGFTEGFDLLMGSLSNRGDIVLCENPTHHTALKIMKSYGLKVIGIPMDEQGINPEALEQAIKDYQPKWVYLTPSYQNPTGIVMSGQRRQEVYKLLSQYQLPCIEDGFNEELLYSGSHVSPMIALGRASNHMIYIGSLSKILFPGLRLGWILADEKLIDILESVKRARNIHTSFLDQAILTQYMLGGAFKRYVKKVRKYYGDKCVYTLECINANLLYEKIWGEGGMYIYIKLDERISTRELLTRCYKRGVLFFPGEVFDTCGKDNSSLRLGFGRLSKTQIETGIKVIGEEVNNMKREKK